MNKLKVQPYPDQHEVLGGLRQSLRAGHRTPLVMASTGFGKTLLAAYIANGFANRNMRVLMTCPYTSLVLQTANKFVEYGMDRPGVIWQNHEWTNPTKNVQIGSLDTVVRRGFPKIDLLIVDECHRKNKILLEYIKNCDHVVIGLSATPFSKWQGHYYDDLIKSRSMRWLIDNGRLSDFEVFVATKKADLSSVKIKNTEYGQDYNESELDAACNTPILNADIVENWLEKGENEPTIAFCISVAHAGNVLQEFTKINVVAEIITAKTPPEERERIFKRFKNRITLVLVSVGCLIAGFDQDVRNIIFARPCKSKILFMQALGRGLRVAESKIKARIFDHTNTTMEVLGFVDDIDITYLKSSSDGMKGEAKEKENEEEKDEALPIECKCGHAKRAKQRECPKCGFTPIFGEEVETDTSMELTAIGRDGKVKKIERVYTKSEKQYFYSQLVGYYNQKTQIEKKTWKEGWIAEKYKAKFKVWPRDLYRIAAEPSRELLSWITSQNIRNSKSGYKKKKAI